MWVDTQGCLFRLEPLIYSITDLVPELFQRGWTLRDTFLGMSLDFLRCEHMVVQQELTHELVPEICNVNVSQESEPCACYVL